VEKGAEIIIPDMTSPFVSGYFRIPAIWIGEKPADDEALHFNPAVHHATACRSNLRCGIKVRAQRNGFFAFDFEKCELAPPVVIPGYIALNDVSVIAPKAHYEAANRAAEYSVLRSQIMNVHQACLMTAGALDGYVPSMMGHPLHSREMFAGMDVDQPQHYAVTPEQARTLAEAVLDNAFSIDFERPYRRQTIKISVIERSFEQQDEILCKSDPHRLIELINAFYVAATRGRDTYRGEALVLAWSVCEQLLSVIWESLIEEVQSGSDSRMNKARRKKLDGRDYTASVVIEMLELQGKLDQELYSHLEKARQARNRWAHKFVAPDLGQIHSSMRAAEILFRKFLGIDLRLQYAAETGSFPSWPVKKD
jgi:uncharacterized protein YutE (UPF0331/DUF86 family)